MVFIQIIWTQEQVAGVNVSISITIYALLKDSLKTCAWCSTLHALDVVHCLRLISTLHAVLETPDCI